MSTNILVAVAWPYANSQIHVGNLTGSYLPADIFSRYQRLIGNKVIMVSGSDAHGTPVLVSADAEGTTAVDVYQKYHAGFIELYQKLGLSYDLFSSTHTENHFKVSQDIFLALLKNGYLYSKREKQWFAPSQGRFLPDRYIEGTCYICGYKNARGDQCDGCGSLLDATQLIEPLPRSTVRPPSCVKPSISTSTWARWSRRSSSFSISARLTGARTCSASRSARSWQMGCTAARYHARPRVGHPGSDLRLGRKMPVRLVRSCDRLSLGCDRMGSDNRSA